MFASTSRRGRASTGLESRLQESAANPRSSTPLVPSDEERAVVERLKEGDRTAFAILYGWYGDPVFRAILARFPDRDLAEDCLRDTFRTALEKITSFTYDNRSIFYWLRRIGVNKAMDVHRRRKRDLDLADRVRVQPQHTMASQPARPDRGLEADDAKRDVEICLGRVNPRYAKVLRMRLIEERSREECAEILGVTVGNLDVLLHRACKAFRKVYPP
jgi:RNA polymerase sigma-70 factor (ECF subfamily)